MKFILLLFSFLHTFIAYAASIPDTIQKDYPHLESLYHDLHQNPELSFHEQETAQRLASELESIGFTVESHIGGYGIVGLYKNGPGPTIMIRTDLDALPVKELTNKSYASTKTVIDNLGKTVPVMHACGHDIHMTVFIGTARRLMQQKDHWQGTLMLVGQPAEERGSGARMMLAEGLFERFPRPDRNLALHVSGNLAAGKVGFIPEYAMANVDSVNLTIYGIGGHGAYPHTTKDPVTLAAQIIMSLQTLVSREISPLESAVVTVGSIHGGTKHNVIPSQVELQLTIRSYTDQVREQLLSGVQRIAKSQALSFGLPEDKLPKYELLNEHTPALYNDPDLVDELVPVFKGVFGADRVVKLTPVMGGEDFSRYGRVEPKIPSLLFWLGAVEPNIYKEYTAAGKTLPSLHTPYFAPDAEPSIITGVQAMTQAALHLFKHTAK